MSHDDERVELLSLRTGDPIKIRKDLENIGGIVIKKKVTTSGWPYFKPLKLGSETFYTLSTKDVEVFTSRRRYLWNPTPCTSGPAGRVVSESAQSFEDAHRKDREDGASDEGTANEIVVFRSYMLYSVDPAIKYEWNSDRSALIFESEEVLTENLAVVRLEDIASRT